MNTQHPDQRGFLEAMIGDGRPVLAFVGLCLLLCGGFAIFQSATRVFLPHDAAYLGMGAKQLCAINQCRVVHFIFHDRVAFGGALIAAGLLYFWLAKFPLRNGEAWAWWTFALSGTFGFASFFTFVGYGYLDTWHGVATLLLLPCFVLGLVRFKRSISDFQGVTSLLRASNATDLHSPAGVGRVLLLVTASGLVLAGLTISVLGATRVFVPQDANYLGLDAAELQAINPRLVPLIAHDRASFGGALLTCGILWLFSVWCGTPSRSLWQVLLVSGTVGFMAAVGIHLVVGYVDLVHLAPAVAGAFVFAAGIALSRKSMWSNAELTHSLLEIAR